MRRAALLCGLAGCGLPETSLEGEHVRVGIDSGLIACGDPVGHMDAFVAALADEWGMAPPGGDGRLSYYWLRPSDFVSRTPCPSVVSACALFGAVYSTVMPLDHELVHALAEGFGTAPVFFREGLAAAYELTPPRVAVMSGEIEAARVLDAVESREMFRLPSELYQLAGAFVGFLVRRHGIAAVLEVYETLRLLDGRRRVSRVFSDVFGESLEQAVEAFAADSAGCEPDAQRLRLFECAAPAIAWDGRRFTEYRTLACDQDDVLGPFFADELAVFRTLEVAEAGWYDVALVGDPPYGDPQGWNVLELARCGGCESFTRVTATVDGGTQRARLPAGRYAVRLTGLASVATGVGMRIERAEVEGGP